MMRKLRFLLPLLGILTALGIATVQAATSATQNVTFSVPAAVSISSNGNVSAGAITADTTATGSFTLSNNDTLGFAITTNAASATTTEAGTGCTPTNSFPAASIQFQAGTMTGQTSGSNGTSTALTNYSTTAQSAYGTNSTAIGTAITMPVSYRIKASLITPNTSNCSYTFATVWTISAN